MKILQINNVYPFGSTGKIVKEIHEGLLNTNYESIVCYAEGNSIKEQNVYKISSVFVQKIDAIISRITGLMYGGCIIQTIKIISIIKKEKPNVVHIHCINGHTVNIYRLIEWLKKNRIKTIITLHAEFIYTANCGYSLDCDKWKYGCGKCPRLKKETKSIFFDNTHLSWKKMYSSFKGFNNLQIVSVSPWLKNRAIDSPILKEFNHSIILNGLNTEIFKAYNTQELRQKLGLENKKIILHVTPFFCNDKNHIKGGYYIIELAKMIKDDNIQILVAGKYDLDIDIPNNITLLGNIDDQQQLAQYYSMSDVFVITSKKETFSMTTAESLCCGTPVVGFKAGAPEQITINEYSEFVEYGNLNELYSEIMNYLSQDKDYKLEKYAKEKYSKEKMIKNYIKLYKEIGKGE